MRNTNKKRPLILPDRETIAKAYEKEKYRRRFLSVFSMTMFSLVVVAAIAVLIVVLFLPVLRIYGTSMDGILDHGDIVISVRGADYQRGDILAFYYNNNILVKRVIATSGEWVNIDAKGNVFVNDEKIEEPYLIEKSYGETNIKLPYQVPDGKIFVLGDNRDVSIDSRHTSIGCISPEQVVGIIKLRIWPLFKIGKI